MTHPEQPFLQESSLYGEERPWGNFLVLLDSETCKVKRIQVMPKQRLSLQKHQHRQEHWIVSQGCPVITLEEKQWQAQPGDYIHILQQQVHRLSNPTDSLLGRILSNSPAHESRRCCKTATHLSRCESAGSSRM
jgi:mannose-6-phosphate isomerase-like protein (cupin superfamily)